MVSIAVLGCGRIGRMHAANIAAHPRARLAGVHDLHQPAAAEVAAAHGVPQFPSAEAVFASPAVDAVLIATSTATHVDFIEQAVRAGKPVLCEKPIDVSLARVDALKARIAGTRVPIMLGFVRRFDPGHAAARAALLAGEVGELLQVTITSRDPAMAPDAYIESSGGIFRDMTIHDLDLGRHLLGEEVTHVSATGSRLIAPALMARCDDWDVAVVTLTTAGGRQAVITNARQAPYGYDQRIEILGTKGMVISGNVEANSVSRFTAEATSVRPPLPHFFIERYAQAFNAEIGAFVDAIERGTPVPVGFEDGRLALLLADACTLSAREGRRVAVSEIG